MNNTMKVLLALAVVVLIAGGALLISNSKKDDKSSDTGTHSHSSDEADSSSGTGAGSDSSGQDDSEVALTITYNGTSFAESTNSIKAGQKVKVVNDSSVVLDFDSDPHPVHTDNTELNVGDIEPGDSKTFIVDKKGTWGYHNHLNSSQHGEIIVE